MAVEGGGRSPGTAGRARNYFLGGEQAQPLPPKLYQSENPTELYSKTTISAWSRRFNAEMPGTITSSSCMAFKVVAETVP